MKTMVHLGAAVVNEWRLVLWIYKKKMLIPNAISNTPTAAFASFQKFTCEFDELYYLVPPMCTSS